MRRLALVLLVLLAGCASAVPVTDAPANGTDTAAPGVDTTARTVDAPPSATPKEGALTAEVVEVVDGDTMKVVFENGSRETIRLLGVDTPEVHTENSPDEFEGVPETEAGRNCLRKWGEQASSVAKERLLGETVTLSFDANEPRRGYYGRLLVYLHVDGGSFNYALITNGLARVYDSQFEYRDRYDTTESAAMDANVGLWACREGGAGSTPTATGTELIADGGIPLRISEVHADAEGDDRENLNDEYVVLKNTGDEQLDLSRFTVTDEADKRYTFPDGTTLAAGETLTLHTGSGTDGDGDYYWSAGSPVWNNGGDTVTVRTASGELVAEKSY
ncbi:lamin tail domain-containing protein [Halolamina sp.]|uniref:lamin tail domain-containing protein n=1 Tax=Halolamina sp. TaxID=1940283 RepID=UPI003567C811